jgi:hypothetical protein
MALYYEVMNTNVDPKITGMTVWVLRNTMGDCTNNGISANADKLTIVAVIDATEHGKTKIAALPGHMHVVAPTEEAPAVALAARNIIGRPHLAIVPLVADAAAAIGYRPEPRWTMFGGHFAELGDSRLLDLVNAFTGYRIPALPIHDRIEQ